MRIETRPVSVSTSIAHRCVPCGKEKLSGSKVASESSEGSTPSGRSCAANTAKASSAIVMPLSVPLTENLPPPHSRSPASASSRWAAIGRAFSITFCAALTTAMPPTTSDRDP